MYKYIYIYIVSMDRSFSHYISYESPAKILHIFASRFACGAAVINGADSAGAWVLHRTIEVDPNRQLLDKTLVILQQTLGIFDDFWSSWRWKRLLVLETLPKNGTNSARRPLLQRPSWQIPAPYSTETRRPILKRTHLLWLKVTRIAV